MVDILFEKYTKNYIYGPIWKYKIEVTRLQIGEKLEVFLSCLQGVLQALW